MSYLAASDPRDLLAIVGGAAVFAGSLYWWSRRERAAPGQVVSQCADGTLIGAWHRGVRRRPPRRPRGFGVAHRILAMDPPDIREDLEPGDLAFVRVREGREHEAPWVVEGMDTDGEAFGIHWEFESPEAAIAAYRLIDERIAEPPVDEAGRAVHLTDRDFDALWRSRREDPAGSDRPDSRS